MNIENAKIHLKIEGDIDADDLLDTLELQVFDLREFFLRQPVVPALFESRIKRLSNLQEAFIAMGGRLSEIEIAYVEMPILTDLSLLDLIETHAGFLASCRSRMASTFWPQPIQGFAKQMIIMQDRYEALFLDLSVHLKTEHHPPVKQADHLNYGEVLHRMRTVDESAVKEELTKERCRIIQKLKTLPR